jgi:hypothetical protein
MTSGIQAIKAKRLYSTRVSPDKTPMQLIKRAISPKLLAMGFLCSVKDLAIRSIL